MTEIRDRRHAAWFWMDKALIDVYGPDIGVYGVAMYALLARYADNKGQAYPSMTTMASLLNISKQSVWRTMNALIAHGLVEKTSRLSEHGDAETNVYTLLHIEWGGSPQELPSSPQDLPSSPQEPGVVPQGNGGGSSQDLPTPPSGGFLTRTIEQELKEKENSFPDQPGKPGKSGRERSPALSRLKRKKAYSDLFWTFYQAYPRHQEPDDAWEAWQSIDGDAMAETIMAGVEANKHANPAWKKGEVKYIKYPAAFLRKGGFKSDFAALPTAGEHDPVRFRQLLDAEGIPYEC